MTKRPRRQWRAVLAPRWCAHGLLAGSLVGAGWLVTACQADGGEQGPPQYLPIQAQWCLTEDNPPRCIDLEVPSGPRQYSIGLQLRPALPPLRGMWS